MAKKTKDAVKRQASAKRSTTGKPKSTKPDCELPEALRSTGFHYERTAKLTKELVSGMGAQPKVIAGALLQANRPLTNAELTKAVSSRLSTRQEPKRVVSFYLVQWRNLGLVKRA